MLSLASQQITLLLVAAVNFAIGVYVLLENPSRNVHRAFFLFVCGITFWILGFVFLSLTTNFFFDKLIHYGGLLVVFGFFLFAHVFPINNPLPNRFWYASLPFLLVACLVIPWNLIVREMIVYPDGRLEPINGPAHLFYIVGLGAYIAWSLLMLRHNYLRVSGRAKLQMKYLFLGMGIFIVAAFVFDALLPTLGISSLNLLGPFFSLLFVGSTAYAIVRHELMDIRVVIQRSAIYSVLLLFVIGFYLGAVSALGYLFQKATHTAILIAAGLTTLVGIFGVPHIERYFRKVTDRFFFKDRYDYSGTLRMLSGIVAKNIDIEILLSKITHAIKEHLKVADVRFVEVGAGELTAAQVSPAMDEITIPVLFENEFKGLIYLGKKLSGDAYSREDMTLLETLSHHLAVALEKDKLFKELKDYSRELERRVEERTSQLRHLQEEQKRMMIDISHGLQTPLTVIKGELSFLKKKMPHNEKVGVFEKSIDEISKFIYDLLNLAKLESAQEDFRKEIVHFSKLLEDLVEYFRVLAKENHIILKSKIEDGITLLGNKEKLEELTINLVSNSMKYLKTKGRKSIFVGLQRARGTIELVVADNGIGINKKDLPSVFDRFYRVKNKKDPSTTGSGLGLAICKKIVEKHDGTISAESNIGKGTKFVVRF